MLCVDRDILRLHIVLWIIFITESTRCQELSHIMDSDLCYVVLIQVEKVLEITVASVFYIKVCVCVCVCVCVHMYV
jgi:hypothetical protein